MISKRILKRKIRRLNCKRIKFLIRLNLLKAGLKGGLNTFKRLIQVNK